MIFPLEDKIMVRKVKIFKKPKFDLSKLMELYKNRSEDKAIAATASPETQTEKPMPEVVEQMPELEALFVEEMPMPEPEAPIKELMPELTPEPQDKTLTEPTPEPPLELEAPVIEKMPMPEKTTESAE